MALVGYARVSSAGQSLEIQEAKLAEAGCDEVFAEKRSGTNVADRQALEECLRFLRKGDILLVTKMDRLARSVADLSALVDGLNARAVGFRVLDQSGIDTTTPNGRLMLHLLAAVAEFETNLRKERQREGIDAAKARGVYTRGRPSSVSEADVRRLKSDGLGATAIAKQLGIGRASVYRALSDA